ncbi:acyl-CoA thioesterase [Carnobacterium mobile]|uniref:acyl-CoA thioesterase n=1 Tax=Carnobacterium mobile TaxID=2750 RepID=UPI001866A62D|nr:acyl-CoA thioesterase [Carnobacterium mobile]
MTESKERKIKRCIESRVVQTHRVLPSDLNHHQTLFGGNLMSLIDNTASISAARHSRGVTVTASMDSLDFLHPIYSNHSVCIESYVSGVGKSSMEVFCKIMGEDLMTGKRYLAATSFSTFVSTKTKEQGDIIVPLVEPTTEEECLVCEGYQKRREKRIINREFNERFANAISYAAPWEAEVF